MACLEAEDLVKVYPGGVVAVDGVSLRECGGLAVVMGPNGSGKTTLLAMLAGALRPTRGRVLVGGLDLWGGDWWRARELIGYQPQEAPVRGELTVEENMVFFGMLRGMSLSAARARARELLVEMGLWEHRGKLARRLSGGLRRRLSIAAALIGEPGVLVLDEPASGLDPAARVEMWSLVKRLSESRVVLASSHVAEEAEEYADRVYIMVRGRVAAHGPPGLLVSRYAPRPVIRVEGSGLRDPRIPGVEALKIDVGEAVYAVADPEEALPRLIEALQRGGARLQRVEVRRPGLREVYLRLAQGAGGS